MNLSRRRFLALSALTMTGSALAACEKEASSEEAAEGSGSGATDGSGQGSGGFDRSGEFEGSGSGPTVPALQWVKGPWSMVAGPTSMRVRFETDRDEEVEVTLVAIDGSRRSGTTTRETRELTLSWPARGLRADHPDRPGSSTLHEVLFTDLQAGERYRVELRAPGASLREGSFRAPPAAGQSFRAIFVADTMWPASERVGAQCATLGADLFLHGGDIQYMTSLVDTWNGYFAYFGGVMGTMASHHAIGNHEYEGFGEFESHFLRLFGGQGAEPPTNGYFAFTFGAARFVFLNSEEDFAVEGGPQTGWLDAELATADADAAIKTVVMVFHRPTYTFGKSAPEVTKRQVLHPRFLRSKVRLVLTGHNHGYERFLVDGVHYVVDAGGGALLTDLNENLDAMELQFPGEAALRVAAESSYGVTILDVAADGTITVERQNDRGAVSERYEVPVP